MVYLMCARFRQYLANIVYRRLSAYSIKIQLIVKLRMEFPQSEQFLKIDQEGFLICSGKNYLSKIKSNTQSLGLKTLGNIINTFGARSAKAQNLKQIITTLDKFSGSDQRIYIKFSGNMVQGFIKVGEKNLFYRDYIGAIKQLKPTCVLDIYVHETCQRNGIGKIIFEKFLQTQDKLPEKLAYDRPSEKLIGFVKKHYNLSKFIPQNNNFVIFDRYFDKTIEKYKPVQLDKNIKTTQQNNQVPILQKQFKDLSLKHNQIQENIAKNNPLKGFPIKIACNYPWAAGNGDRRAFRTTSGTYGSHYNK